LKIFSEQIGKKETNILERRVEICYKKFSQNRKNFVQFLLYLYMNKQHVQVPNDMLKNGNIKLKDLLIYASIKKYMNKYTKEAFPSLKTLSELSGISIPTIRKSIKTLVQHRYIIVRKEGRKNIYKFTSYKNFEPFSYNFLEQENVTTMEKSLVLGLQQLMYKDVEGYGKITIPDADIAKKVNTSLKTLKRTFHSLQDKGLLNIVATKIRDKETGLFVTEKIFHLNKLEQEIVFILQNHEDRIMNTEERTSENEKKIKILQRQVEILLRENKKLNEEKIEDAICL
jgi:DNA-binding GntR family transcriptional regulator